MKFNPWFACDQLKGIDIVKSWPGPGQKYKTQLKKQWVCGRFWPPLNSTNHGALFEATRQHLVSILTMKQMVSNWILTI